MKEPHGQRSYYPRHQPGGIGPARHGTRKNPAYRSGSSLHGAPNCRAELDEHVQSVESAEIDADLQMGSRSKADVLQEIRDKVSVWPGINVSLGQPISHRIDHMLSGTLANIALKIFGDDLRTLRLLGRQEQTSHFWRARRGGSKPGTADGHPDAEYLTRSIARGAVQPTQKVRSAIASRPRCSGPRLVEYSKARSVSHWLPSMKIRGAQGTAKTR